jgi:thiol-disulfide isomerase/thioredoxin
MKARITFLLILISLILSNCTSSKKEAKSYTLQGKIIGQDTGIIVIQYGLLSTYHKDIAKISNGIFTFNGMIEEPTRAWINAGDELNSTEIYLEPGLMSATLTKDKYKDINLTGSKSQEELNKLNKLLESSKNHDSVLVNFVLKNPKSYLTPYYLYSMAFTKARDVVFVDSLKAIFNGLDLSVQNSIYGRAVKGVIRINQNITEGATATEFKAIDLNDQPIYLSQYKGKNVVLLDFWNSTCGPCRKGMTHLRLLYKQYHSKGLEIIAVDCIDKDRNAWISAINQDSTNMFHHVATYFRTGEIINEDITLDFPGNGMGGGIPQTIVINKDGIVAGSWYGYSKENDDSLDKKLAETFNNKKTADSF